HHLPVPAFFDYPETRTALWREKSIKAIRDLQERASILLFSIGAEATGSYIHTAGYLGEEERQILRDEGLVGDIATIFFRAD
ncbi:sugar-binding domain-containing protein, partial [Acinetobacter baumannii]